MTRIAALLFLVACSPNTTITVDVEDMDQISIVEVVDQDTWAGEADSGAAERFYEAAEDPALPVVFEVPAGDYTVVIAQGACNKTTDITVNRNENVDVSLALECSE